MLIVDDASFRAVLRATIEACGFRVVGEAADGAEGVRLARKLAPDVITMDLEMPMLDGADGDNRAAYLRR